MRKDQASATISAHVTKRLGQGWDQDSAIAEALHLATTKELSVDATTKGANEQRKIVELKDADVDMAAMEFAGYASTWDKDEVDDIIEPGAFKRTIQQRGPDGANKIKVLYQHSDPIGVPVEMREDDRGLYTRSRISNTALGRDVMQLINDGVISAMSVGFSIPEGKADMEDDQWTRHIREAKLFEYSAVAFPANEEAVIEMAARLSATHKAGRLTEHSRQRIKSAVAELQMITADSPNGTRLDDDSDSGLTDSLAKMRQWAQNRLY
mgnify:CR=1 FL=1